MSRHQIPDFPPPAIITDTDALTTLCQRLARESFVTVDTEFMRERTYYPELCLVQLAGETEVAIVDATATSLDLAPLGELLADPGVVKVFHAARQDVEIFVQKFGAVPAPLFDTQVAAMVAGFGDQVGYDSLVSGLTGGSIDKAHRFSDWSARPLSLAQLDYAAADVTWLRIVYRKLRARLEEEGRLAWVGEEMAILANPNTYRTDPETAWERLKVRGNNRRFLALVRALAAWREQEAQRINIPRQRLLKDETLTEIAAIAPDSAEALSRARGITRGFAEGRTGASLLEVVAAARAVPDAGLPASPHQRDAVKPSAALVQLLKVLLAARCEEHAVAPKLIASSDDIERIASDDTSDIPALKGWRRVVFGDDAIALREGRVALGVDGRRIRLIPVA
ncbi:MAG: ribonuclease D [Acetobacteraceae bacterium]|nr:ribonuclease D [Acetobacteraceae bacterium]